MRAWCVPLVSHPHARPRAPAAQVLFLNLYIYFADPSSYSNSECYTTGVGTIYHGWFEMDTAAFVVPRVTIMFVTGALGAKLGRRFHGGFLRDTLHLTMFGHDADSDNHLNGVFFVTLVTCMMSWLIGARIYNALLLAVMADPCDADQHLIGDNMCMTYAQFNLIATIFAFACDWYTCVTVVDQIFQGMSDEVTGLTDATASPPPGAPSADDDVVAVGAVELGANADESPPPSEVCDNVSHRDHLVPSQRSVTVARVTTAPLR